MSVPRWVNDYVGIEFGSTGPDGVRMKCWGLVRRVFAEQFGIDVPAYANDAIDPTDGEAVAAEIERVLAAEACWRELGEGEAEQLGDVVLFKVPGRRGWRIWHVGLVTGAGWMLHTRAGVDACQERYREVGWQIIGFWRHERLEHAAFA